MQQAGCLCSSDQKQQSERHSVFGGQPTLFPVDASGHVQSCPQALEWGLGGASVLRAESSCPLVLQ